MNQPKKRRRVYVAGPITGTTMKFLENIRHGIQVSTRLVKEGNAVFSPFIDFQFNLTCDEPLTEAEYKEHSMAWLEVSDLVYVLRGWQDSHGTIAEMKRASELGIPVEFERLLESV